jgi:hypothetical protein
MEFPAVDEFTRTARRAVSSVDRRGVSLTAVIDWRTRPKLVRVLSNLAVNAVILIAMALISFASFRVALAAEEPLPAEDGRQLALVRPNDMNTGALLLPSKEPGRFVETPRLSTDVDMRINGPIARITVTQRFENPGDGWVEGIYVFPLPEMSTVDTLRMRIGDRLIEGVIKIREEARTIYEEAKREGKKAALLEQQRENLFTNSRRSNRIKGCFRCGFPWSSLHVIRRNRSFRPPISSAMAKAAVSA